MNKTHERQKTDSNVFKTALFWIRFLDAKTYLNVCYGWPEFSHLVNKDSSGCIGESRMINTFSFVPDSFLQPQPPAALIPHIKTISVDIVQFCNSMVFNPYRCVSFKQFTGANRLILRCDTLKYQMYGPNIYIASLFNKLPSCITEFEVIQETINFRPLTNILDYVRGYKSSKQPYCIKSTIVDKNVFAPKTIDTSHFISHKEYIFVGLFHEDLCMPPDQSTFIRTTHNFIETNQRKFRRYFPYLQRLELFVTDRSFYVSSIDMDYFPKLSHITIATIKNKSYHHIYTHGDYIVNGVNEQYITCPDTNNLNVVFRDSPYGTEARIKSHVLGL